MSNRLVVGVNSPYSSTTIPLGPPAVDWAVEYARPRHLDIELVHVMRQTRSLLTAEVRGELLLGAEQQLRGQAERLMEASPGLRVHATVLEGAPADGLSDRAANAQLLVIGSHPLKRFSNLVFSTRAAQIAARVATSVVIIPTEAAEVGHGVVVGVDGSPASLAAVEFAAEEADRLDEPLTVVYAWRLPAPWTIATIEVDWPIEPGDADRLLLAESIAGLAEKYPDLQIIEDMNDALPVDALIAVATGARLLVVGTHGRQGVVRFWLGSVSHELILAMPCPLAVIRSTAIESE